MQIFLVTSVEKPELTKGDQLLRRQLESSGVVCAPLVWDGAEVTPAAGDLVVMRSVWDYHLKFGKFKEWLLLLEHAGVQIVNPVPTLVWNADKKYLLELASSGLNTVPTLHFSKGGLESEMALKIEAMQWKDTIVKPSVSATAHMTFRCRGAEECLDAALRVLEIGDVLIQKFVPSVQSEGEVSLVFFNDGMIEFSHALRKTPKSGDFRVQSDFGGGMQKWEPSESVLSSAMTALRSLSQAWVYARVDLLDWSSKPLIGEIELFEPDLYLEYEPSAVSKFSDILLRLVSK